MYKIGQQMAFNCTQGALVYYQEKLHCSSLSFHGILCRRWKTNIASFIWRHQWITTIILLLLICWCVKVVKLRTAANPFFVGLDDLLFRLPPFFDNAIFPARVQLLSPAGTYGHPLPTYTSQTSNCYQHTPTDYTLVRGIKFCWLALKVLKILT